MLMMSRDKDEALCRVRYQLRLHFLHVRLYGRIRKCVALVSLVLGSTALYGAFKNNVAAVGLSGIIVAVLSISDIVMDWSDRAARHGVWRRRMADLLVRSHKLDTAAIDRELSQIEGEIDDEFESLRVPAMNDVLRSNGMDDAVRPEAAMQRLFRILAA
jgi:hypothetical protein